MTRIYISYGLTILSAFIVFEMLGIMSTVAAGYTWIPFSGFIASILHFGLSSWLFLHFPRTCKVLAILTAIAMCIWPIGAFIDSIPDSDASGIIFLLPVVLSGLLIYNHIKTFTNPRRPSIPTRIILSVIPFGLFLAFIILFWLYN